MHVNFIILASSITVQIGSSSEAIRKDVLWLLFGLGWLGLGATLTLTLDTAVSNILYMIKRSYTTYVQARINTTGALPL